MLLLLRMLEMDIVLWCLHHAIVELLGFKF